MRKARAGETVSKTREWSEDIRDTVHAIIAGRRSAKNLD